MIKAIFPAGVTDLTVHGLHQWDYGRKLQITHPTLPTVLEVHFATVGSREAIVRSVSGVSGTATTDIPNSLLEQSQPIQAWVVWYTENGASTMLTITLPVIARPRPAKSPTMPEELEEPYEAVLAALNDTLAEVNAKVKALQEGAVKALNAYHADEADQALRAIRDGNGRNISDTYARIDKGVFTRLSADHALEAGAVYQIKVHVDGIVGQAILTPVSGEAGQACLGWGVNAYGRRLYLIGIGTDCTVEVWENQHDLASPILRADAVVYYRKF